MISLTHKTRFNFRRHVAALTAAALLAMGAPALAEPPPGASSSSSSSSAQEAGTRFRHGVDLFKEADFRGALIEFRRAYQTAPNAHVFYNIAQCHLELQDYAGALRAFERYLAEGGAEIQAPRRAAVEIEIGKLKPRVAHVQIACNVAGAEIRIDDDIVGTTPLAQPIIVSAGRRRISAEKPGMPLTTRVVDVAGGDSLDIALEVREPTATAPTPSPVRAALVPQEPSGGRTAMWVGWTATGALAIGAGVTGFLALRAKNDLNAQQNAFPASAADLGTAQSRMRAFALTTDILAGAAVIAGGVSIYLTLTSPKKERGASAPSARLGFAPMGLILDGAF